MLKIRKSKHCCQICKLSFSLSVTVADSIGCWRHKMSKSGTVIQKALMVCVCVKCWNVKSGRRKGATAYQILESSEPHAMAELYKQKAHRLRPTYCPGLRGEKKTIKRNAFFQLFTNSTDNAPVGDAFSMNKSTSSR